MAVVVSPCAAGLAVAVSPVGASGAPGCTVVASATFEAGLKPSSPGALRAFTR